MLLVEFHDFFSLSFQQQIFGNVMDVLFPIKETSVTTSKDYSITPLQQKSFFLGGGGG